MGQIASLYRKTRRVTARFLSTHPFLAGIVGSLIAACIVLTVRAVWEPMLRLAFEGTRLLVNMTTWHLHMSFGVIILFLTLFGMATLYIGFLQGQQSILNRRSERLQPVGIRIGSVEYQPGYREAGWGDWRPSVEGPYCSICGERVFSPEIASRGEDAPLAVFHCEDCDLDLSFSPGVTNAVLDAQVERILRRIKKDLGRYRLKRADSDGE